MQALLGRIFLLIEQIAPLELDRGVRRLVPGSLLESMKLFTFNFFCYLLGKALQ